MIEYECQNEECGFVWSPRYTELCISPVTLELETLYTRYRPVYHATGQVCPQCQNIQIETDDYKFIKVSLAKQK